MKIIIFIISLFCVCSRGMFAFMFMSVTNLQSASYQGKESVIWMGLNRLNLWVESTEKSHGNVLQATLWIFSVFSQCCLSNMRQTKRVSSDRVGWALWKVSHNAFSPTGRSLGLSMFPLDERINQSPLKTKKHFIKTSFSTSEPAEKALIRCICMHKWVVAKQQVVYLILEAERSSVVHETGRVVVPIAAGHVLARYGLI